MNIYHLKLHDLKDGLRYHQSPADVHIALFSVLDVFGGTVLGKLSTMWRVETPLTFEELVCFVNDELQRMK